MNTKRWRLAIVRDLEDLPRHYAALEHAMASFGTDFDLQQFEEACDTSDDMDAYNRVQAVERALGRVQNHVGELAEAGVKLAALPRRAIDGVGLVIARLIVRVDVAVVRVDDCKRRSRSATATRSDLGTEPPTLAGIAELPADVRRVASGGQTGPAG